jgi:HK97 family phage prohead protease
MTTTMVFYPVVAGVPFAYGGILERHAAGLMERGLREQNEIVCLVDHDPHQRVASTADSSLVVTIEASGVRCELTHLPDTAPGRRLARALAMGEVTGASFGFSPRRARWYLGRQPVRELVDADVREVSLVLAPHNPRIRTPRPSSAKVEDAGTTVTTS